MILPTDVAYIARQTTHEESLIERGDGKERLQINNTCLSFNRFL